MSRALSPQSQDQRWQWSTWVNVRLFIIALSLLLGASLVVYSSAEWLWFAEVGYLQVFTKRWLTQIGLGVVTFAVSGVWLIGQMQLAHRWRYVAPVESSRAKPVVGLRLRFLLPIAFGLAVLLGMMLLYHGQVVREYWQPDLTLYSRSDTLPLQFRPAAIVEVIQQLAQQQWSVGPIVGFAIALLIYPEQVSLVAAVLMSLGFGLVLSEQWVRVLPWFQPTLFDQVDPLFNRDISFYVFHLPILQLVEFWLIGLFSFSLTAVVLVYFLSGNSLSQGRFPGFNTRQKRHLCGLSGGLLLAIALGHWLARYELLYSPRGVTYGASYTDINVQLPLDLVLVITALMIGLTLLHRAIFWGMGWPDWWIWLKTIAHARQLTWPKPYHGRLQRAYPIFYALGLYLITATILGVIIPAGVQSFIVQPNELARERPYIERTIEFTRNAFALNTINSKIFVPQGNLDAATLQENDLTIRNIRLWDTRPLLESNRQLQQIRLYYEFSDADVDRYAIKQPDGTAKRRQVFVAARELNYDRVPDEAKTWVNEHLIYTHGYGFTMSPVNTASSSGLPEYFIQDIAHNASNPQIEASIPVGTPRIYFGELTNTYIMTQTQVQELDYPSGSDNVYTRYQGEGGIAIGSWWRRLLFSRYLRDWKMLFTQDFTPETRLLFRRNIVDRVRTIAPFLRYDSDPYLVVAAANFTNQPIAPEHQAAVTIDGDVVASDAAENYLYWVIDAYTTSDLYPYSDPAGNDFNYIRNSVKVVVDAYNGKVYFYIADPTDPIIQTWRKIFPGVMRSLDEMPPNLRAHIRYPQDFYQVQADELMTYHMTDPQVFYNREDQWRAPNEIYGNESQRVEPYYLTMKLPEEEGEEFILLRPYTPAQRNNMIAWLASRSDQDDYGKTLLYRFPKQELVFGPEQIEARINQDPVISQRISLWNRQGSRAIQGNLLVIPIADSLLYVEPLYLEAEQNSLPILARVIVVYQNQIAMAETLEGAIAAIFQPDAADPDADAIIREVEADGLINDVVPAPPDTPPTAPAEAAPSNGDDP